MSSQEHDALRLTENSILEGTPWAKRKKRTKVWTPPPDHKERPPTQAEVWEMIAGCQALLKREVGRMLPKARIAEFDDMYADVVHGRAISIMSTWRVGKGAAWLTHFVHNARWYAYKWVHRRNGHWDEPKVVEQLEDPFVVVDSDDNRPEFGVDLVLHSLPAEDAQIIRWRVLDGYDFDEISEHLRITPAKTRQKYIAAIRRARGILWKESQAGMFLTDLLDALSE